MAKRKAAKRKQIDVELVRQAAMGRWPEILVSVAEIPADWLDGRHHPCPQCGGKDRFRLLASSTGGCFCNQCFRTKNGDGFAAIQWASGVDFVAAVHAVADYLGIDATAIGGGGQRSHLPTNTSRGGHGTTRSSLSGAGTSPGSRSTAFEPPAAGLPGIAIGIPSWRSRSTAQSSTRPIRSAG